MSSEPTPSPAPAPPPVLSLHERRVLGVLVEKQKTTPDVYPLSLNALQTGCNQKSNRDPVLDMNELDVEEALISTQKQGLTIKVTGGRVERWRHGLYDAWKVGKVELAILGELLLRGPQTEGELRGRVSRMEPVADLDALRALLKPLAERTFVVYLTEENRRGTVLTHGFHDPRELEKLRERHAGSVAAAEQAAEPRERREAPAPGRLDEALAQIAALRVQIAELQTTVADLATQVRDLQNKIA